MVSWNHHVNAAAIGVGIDMNRRELTFRVYHPSDTARNLGVCANFTFSLSDSPELFYKAALTGNNGPGSELSPDELVTEDGFYYPRDASRIFFCRLESTVSGFANDKYGRTPYGEHKAYILGTKGEGVYIGRENPYLDAMVHASRYHIVTDEGLRDEIRRKVIDILKDEKGGLADRIILHVEGDVT